MVCCLPKATVVCRLPAKESVSLYKRGRYRHYTVRHVMYGMLPGHGSDGLLSPAKAIPMSYSLKGVKKTGPFGHGYLLGFRPYG